MEAPHSNVLKALISDFSTPVSYRGIQGFTTSCSLVTPIGAVSIIQCIRGEMVCRLNKVRGLELVLS